MTYTILVIDDESVTRRLVKHTLKALEYVETLMAENGEEALQLANAHEISLAIVDINLPDIDGFTLIGRLQAIPHMEGVPMVVFTARNDPQDELLTQQSGAVGLLYKPFSTTELRELVQKHLGL